MAIKGLGICQNNFKITISHKVRMMHRFEPNPYGAWYAPYVQNGLYITFRILLV